LSVILVLSVGEVSFVGRCFFHGLFLDLAFLLRRIKFVSSGKPGEEKMSGNNIVPL
jgi:hypothetical protein